MRIFSQRNLKVFYSVIIILQFVGGGTVLYMGMFPWENLIGLIVMIFPMIGLYRENYIDEITTFKNEVAIFNGERIQPYFYETRPNRPLYYLAYRIEHSWHVIEDTKPIEFKIITPESHPEFFL